MTVPLEFASLYSGQEVFVWFDEDEAQRYVRQPWILLEERVLPLTIIYLKTMQKKVTSAALAIQR